jgi:hypothetical protein
MNLSLVRNSAREDGIFSQILDETEHEVCMTLEHAYPDGKGGWAPKIYAGTFECVRGKHRLHGMAEDFETFEITGVADHSNLLFHWGNWNENSEGCVLVGEFIAEGYRPGAPHTEMITNSRVVFAAFMKLQEGVDQFTLEVV